MVVTRLAILGATGSIGRQALDVVASHADRLRVTAIASARNRQALAALAKETGATTLVLQERDGNDALCDLVTRDDVDLVLVATPGIAGLAPTIAALKAGKRVALANKEVLITGGHLVRPLAGGAGERLRPVDSEHSALWQCFVGEKLEDVTRVAITASGGPFRERALDEIENVTPEEALRHPTWKMGPKVTIDSATLANKGYEVVETHWLYGLPYDKIDIVIHPESVVHALVEFADGSVKAQLAEPDMRLPIQYALLWDRAPSRAKHLDLSRVRALNFDGPPDPARYPCLEVVLETARSENIGAMIGLSAADEVAVSRFLRGDIRFGEISAYLQRGAKVGAAHRIPKVPSLKEVLALDLAVRGALESTPVMA